MLFDPSNKDLNLPGRKQDESSLARHIEETQKRLRLIRQLLESGTMPPRTLLISCLKTADQHLSAVEQKIKLEQKAEDSKYHLFTNLADSIRLAKETFDDGPTQRALRAKQVLSNCLTWGTIGTLGLISLEPILYANHLTNISPSQFFSEKIPTTILFLTFLAPFISGSLIHFVNRSLNTTIVSETMSQIDNSAPEDNIKVPKLSFKLLREKTSQHNRQSLTREGLPVKPKILRWLSLTTADLRFKFYYNYYDRLQNKFDIIVSKLSDKLMPFLTGSSKYSLIRQTNEEENALATLHLAQQRANGKSTLPNQFSITSALCLATSWFPCELLASRLLNQGSIKMNGAALGISFITTATPWILSFLQNHLIAGSYAKYPLVHASAHYVKIASRISNIAIFSIIASGFDSFSKLIGLSLTRYRQRNLDSNKR